MKEDFSKIIILVQAPADIPYALDIIQRHKSSAIYVYAINVENIYKLLKTLLNEKIQLEYIPYPFVGYNSLGKIIKTRKEFVQAWNQHFKTIAKQCLDAYFFSKFEDAFTAFVIGRFSTSKGINIHYINHYDSPMRTIGLRDYVRSIIFNVILYFITRSHFKITYWGKYPELDVAYYKNIDEQKIDIADIDLTQYLYSIDRQPAILFLVNPKYDVCGYDYEDYIELIKIIAHRLKNKGLVIYMKGHPRMGLPIELAGVYDERIEDYVISELIDYTKFKLIIGCESTSIAHAALKMNGTAISILKMIKVINDVKINRQYNYLCNQSRGRVVFVKTVEEIINIYESSSD